MKTLGPRHCKFDQAHYVKNLKTIARDGSFKEYRRGRALLSWMLQTRPDLACVANKAAQVSEKTFGKYAIALLNTAVNRTQETQDHGLEYRALDLKSLHLRTYVDASFATNEDFSSQICYLIFCATTRTHYTCWITLRRRPEESSIP